jgi:cysteine desulfuration protein SufE
MNQYKSCQLKQQKVVERFSNCESQEKKYQKIIEFGTTLLPYPPHLKTVENLVSGCQSQMHLYAELIDGKIHFLAHSEALISCGLAALLISVYDGESPETILKCPPDHLTTLGIQASLSPSRSNGLSSLYIRMKQEALKILLSARGC